MNQAAALKQVPALAKLGRDFFRLHAAWVYQGVDAALCNVYTSSRKISGEQVTLVVSLDGQSAMYYRGTTLDATFGA